MSFDVLFDFSTGLEKSLWVPAGTIRSLRQHVADVEVTLGLVLTEENSPHWDFWKRDFGDISDDDLCETVEAHNQWVLRCWSDFEAWHKNPVADGEELTPEIAATFWHGLERLKVEPARWTKDYYCARMNALYEAMRGRAADGMRFDARALSEKQAGAIINLFDQYLDPADMRLEVPHGHDYLASSYDGGYDWCGTCCRAIHPDDIGRCRRRKCELRETL